MSVEELEHDLQFRRFSPERQEQIRQLVCYATLMGLNGKDLISIGGTWDRSLSTAKRKENIAIAKHMWNKHLVHEIHPRHYWEKVTMANFTAESGNKYELTYTYGAEIVIKQFLDKKKKDTVFICNFTIPEYDCGNSKKSYIYRILVAIHNQDLKLR